LARFLVGQGLNSATESLTLARLAADAWLPSLAAAPLVIARTSNDMKYKAIALYVAVSRELGGIRPLDHLGDRNHQSRNRSVVGACVF
jgi:hypothetical protein